MPKSSGGSYLSRVLIESRMVEAPVLRFEGTEEFNNWDESQRIAVMQDWLDETVKPLVEALNPALMHCFGEDFARTGDLTDIVPLEIGQGP